MVNFPKQRKTYCNGKGCHKHTLHKVTQYKKGKVNQHKQGNRRYNRKQQGFGGQTKPILKKKAKNTKKITLKLECSSCKRKKMQHIKRCKHFELGGEKKKKYHILQDKVFMTDNLSKDEKSFLHVDRNQLDAADTSWSENKLVWVPDEMNGYVSVKDLGSAGKGKTKVMNISNNKEMIVNNVDIQKMNPPKFQKIEDMSRLTNLNEASVFHNLRDRYYSGLIYTYSGLFCVVINPYRSLPIYSENVMNSYHRKKRSQMPPHIFCIADNAFQNLSLERENQSILCTGESGAGKTENTKKIIQYLANSTNAKKKHDVLTKQLLTVNNILEAFGNAKTKRNDNSSRFGKFIKIKFNNVGHICGARIDTYLLEKSRSINQHNDERNFHIFYQLMHGLSSKEKDEYLLNDFNSFKYIKNANLKAGDIDDKKEYDTTLESMKLEGFEEGEIKNIIRCLSGIMHLGNVEYAVTRSDQASIKDNT
ncbi:60S ribosomal protein L44, partial [Intoshia linei]